MLEVYSRLLEDASHVVTFKLFLQSSIERYQKCKSQLFNGYGDLKAQKYKSVLVSFMPAVMNP
jgi:hypothetical protein